MATDHTYYLHSYPSLILPVGRRQGKTCSSCLEGHKQILPYAYWFWLELMKFYSFFPFLLHYKKKKISPVLWTKTGKPKIMGIDFVSSRALSEWSSSSSSFSIPSWHIVLYVYFKCFTSNHCTVYSWGIVGSLKSNVSAKSSYGQIMSETGYIFQDFSGCKEQKLSV